MSDESLRDRKKRLTRQSIADAAIELFLDRGFDAVTVAEVAVAAGVSEKTVFNYFSCKEELFFDLFPLVEREIVHIVKNRPQGQSVMDALRTFGTAAAPGEANLHAELAAAMRKTSSSRHPKSRFDEVVAESPKLVAWQAAAIARVQARLVDALNDEIPAHDLAGRAAAAVLGAAVVAALQLDFAFDPTAERPGHAGFDAIERGFAGWLRRR